MSVRHLSIATTHTQARYALPEVISAFIQEYPDVAHMRKARRHKLLKWLQTAQWTLPLPLKVWSNTLT